MKKFLLIAIILPVITFAAPAQIDSLWERANVSYSNEEYQEALELYKQIEESGVESAALYYNMGNAYFKMNYLARSILYYEKAIRLDPKNPDISYNLTVARDHCIDRIEPVPHFFVSEWLRKSHQALPSGIWAAFSSILLVMALVFFLLFLFARGVRFRKMSFILSILIFLFFVTSTVFAWQSKKEATREDIAIVVSAVCPIKSAPGVQGKDLLVLHEGTRVRVLEEMGEWVRIELEDGRQGWVLLHEIVFVY
ncbi:MAG: tetratricopeptide repeat protein [Bacteroidales bacterium]|nr:tetratricopeptide repeat protein [Bacteroidales bacterium]